MHSSFKLVLIGAIFALGCSNQKEPPPVLGALPDFALVDQDGETFDRDALTGDVWVADFIFTHCRSSCPRLTAHMEGLQTRLKDVPTVQFLSVTVDPTNDTPEVLKDFMTENELSDANWRFVTGDEAAIRELVVDGFKVGLADGQKPGDEAVMHSNHFVLVDDSARVRGYYRANNEGIADLERDLRRIAPPSSIR